MAKKEAILENVDMYTADELVRFIKEGVVTYDELCDDTDGQFAANVRREVERKLVGSEEEDWQRAKASRDIDAVERYLMTYQDGSHREEARQLLRLLNEEPEAPLPSRDAWEDVDKSSVDALKEFKQKYPNDPHFPEATKLINEILIGKSTILDKKSMAIKIKNIQADKNVINANDEIHKTIVDALKEKKFTIAELMEMIKDDNNILHASVIRDLMLVDKYLDVLDLLSLNIDREFVDFLSNGENLPNIQEPEHLEKINKVCEEIYFWGIPSSGKSCALGAILSVANNGHIAKTMIQDNDSQGYDYMNVLSSLFELNGTVCVLPPGTPTASTYEMGFDLEDDNRCIHPLTCIDLAGELLKCMYKSDAHLPMSDEEVEALDTLTRVLIDNRSINQKIHFFVIEYGAEDRKYEGKDQKVYLNAALRYIERTGIFKKDTDAIYLMISKADKAKAGKGQLPDILRDYIHENYEGFYNGLTKICRDCDINNGQVEIIPFSLGKVCFQDFCMFNEKPAANVVRKLISRSKGFKHDKFHRGLNIFKK